ncbi:MAG: type II secretion system F family protein [Mycobacteriales bacterium]
MSMDAENAVIEQPVDETAAVGEETAAAPKKSNILQRVAQFELTPKRVPRRDLMHFSRQMAVFMRAGIPILEALDGITEEMGNEKFKVVLADVRARLVGGETFAGACAEHPEAFPNFYLGMLRTAELSGTLDSVLIQLAEYIERDLDARRKITSALMYPAIIAVVGIVVVVVLVAWVLPRFRTFFKELNAKLPLPTRMLLAVSDFTKTYWWVLLVVAGLIVVVAAWMMLVAEGRRVRDKMLLTLPAIGDLVQHIILERFCRIMSSMISAGVPLPEALLVTSDATSNVIFQEKLGVAREAMVRGAGLALPLAETGLFPSAARQMLRVGEDTGSLDEQLETASVYYGRELEYKIKKFTGLFEPAVILVMGVLVGFVAIALVSAMYGVFHQVHP